MDCSRKQELWHEYKLALTAFNKAMREHAEVVSLGSPEGSLASMKRRIAASDERDEAYNSYLEHLREHGCQARRHGMASGGVGRAFYLFALVQGIDFPL